MTMYSPTALWPDFFPGDCPPSDALLPNHQVYRFVGSFPPQPTDFKSHKERWPSRDFGEQECKACGLSVFTDFEDIRVARSHVPGMAKKHIVCFGIDNAEGLIKATPATSHYGRSHHTWWKPSLLSVESRCVAVDDLENEDMV